jgi:hypothetical protein
MSLNPLSLNVGRLICLKKSERLISFDTMLNLGFGLGSARYRSLNRNKPE